MTSFLRIRVQPLDEDYTHRIYVNGEVFTDMKLSAGSRPFFVDRHGNTYYGSDPRLAALTFVRVGVECTSADHVDLVPADGVTQS